MYESGWNELMILDARLDVMILDARLDVMNLDARIVRMVGLMY